MSRPHRTPKTSRAVAVGAAVALPFTLVACGESGTAGPETGADVESITEEDWFSTEQYVGEKVTVSSTVLRTLSAQAFVLAGEDYGDDSLLVLSKNEMSNLEPGMEIKVTGVVRVFNYDEYVEPYGLYGAGPLYEPFESEEFLVAKKIDKSIEGPTSTTRSSG